MPQTIEQRVVERKKNKTTTFYRITYILREHRRELVPFSTTHRLTVIP